MRVRAGVRWGRRRHWPRLFAITGVVVVLAGPLDLALAASRVDHLDVVLPPSTPGRTYVLIGSDSRGFVVDPEDRRSFGDPTTVPGQRADIVLVVHVPPSGPTSLLAIPRDLVVLSGGVPTRLGLTMLPGPQGLVDALCGSLGIAADHVVVVDFDGFREVIDAVGGVAVDVPVPIRDEDSGLAPLNAGDQVLDGRTALAYVRSRKGEVLLDGEWVPEVDGAEGRTIRARTVLLAAMSATLDAAPDPIALHRAGWAAANAVATDDETGLRDLLQLARSLDGRGSGGADVTLPVETVPSRIPVARFDVGARDALAIVGVDTAPSSQLACRPTLLDAESTIHPPPATGGLT